MYSRAALRQCITHPDFHIPSPVYRAFHQRAQAECHFDAAHPEATCLIHDFSGLTRIRAAELPPTHLQDIHGGWEVIEDGYAEFDILDMEV